ncbi:hypothetical protein BH24DEI2_BH24DEI2_27080 [soil metagenome]
MSTTVVALYDREDQAEAALHDLTDAGFERGHLELVAHDAAQTGDRDTGFWEKLFDAVDAEDAEHIAEGVRRGGAALAVTVADDTLDAAETILNQHNPVDIDERVTKWREAGYSGHDRTSPPYDAAQVEAERERYVIPVIEEDITVGKRTVEGDGKRVRTFVRETPVEESVTLREERVHVQRRPADRVATEADFQEQSLEMHETHEEVVVSKEARVVEEVLVEKEAVERTETVRGTERKTEIEVEDLGEKTRS